MPSKKISLPDINPIGEIDLTIHAPARLLILTFLAAVESTDFTFLLNQTQLTRGNLSTHLKRLEDDGYITVQKEFIDRIPRSLYKLTSNGKGAIVKYCETIQKVIDQLAN
jgi:DNA-binding MarR family transcriptional regulator